MINSSLKKMFGHPMNASEGNYTKAKSKHPKMDSSIMANPNTKSNRCGYGVNGVGGKKMK